MVGDLRDIVSRLRDVLPRGWFSEHSPNLDAILASISNPWAWLFSLISYVSAQTRITTAGAEWLDLVALDFFGHKLGRKTNETDSAFRRRIRERLLPDAATRGAICAGIGGMVGKLPTIFEPANCGDTGSYGSLSINSRSSFGGAAYGYAGGWGNLHLPYQFFITTTRPPTPGIGLLSGYGVSTGGYGTGSTSYVDLSSLAGYVTDEEIYEDLCKLLPVNTIAWIRIE
jgi:hypothetical protein